MKKSVVALAAVVMMTGSAIACVQQPENKEASAATEQTAPAPEAASAEAANEAKSEEPAKADEKACEGASAEKCGSAASDEAK